MIGKWIDSLTDKQRDRIIEHLDPTYRGSRWWDKSRDCGCLVGCVVAAELKHYGLATTHESIGLYVLESYDKRRVDVGLRFPVLVRRFSPERIWRVVKARAARRNRVEALRTPELQAVEA